MCANLAPGTASMKTCLLAASLAAYLASVALATSSCPAAAAAAPTAMPALTVYLSGEIHTSWREEIRTASKGLDVAFTSPVTDHATSDDCGVAITGAEPQKFWHDSKGARLNAVRTRLAIEKADVVVVRFGDKYKQWNAAFDAGYAAALGKSIVVIHGDDIQHPLKEVDAAAAAVVKENVQVADVLRYLIEGMLPAQVA